MIGLRNLYYVNPVYNKIRIRTWLNVFNVHLIPFDTFCRSLPTRRINSVQCNFVWNAFNHINDAQFSFNFVASPVFYFDTIFRFCAVAVVCRCRLELPRCVVKTSTCSADGIKLANDTLFFCFRRQCLDLLTKDSYAARQYLYRSVFSVRFSLFFLFSFCIQLSIQVPYVCRLRHLLLRLWTKIRYYFVKKKKDFSTHLVSMTKTLFMTRVLITP